VSVAISRAIKRGNGQTWILGSVSPDKLL
jgi:hypothetical protein